jgi:dihydroorotase
MNPPLRATEDRLALIEGIQDGTIDMIATDHAPHSAEEKAMGLAKSPFGIVGLETAFPVMYTHLVRTGVISMELLMQLMVYRPRERFGISMGEDFSVWKLDKSFVVDPEEFLSMGHATPFEGWRVKGRALLTLVDGEVAYAEAR